MKKYVEEKKKMSDALKTDLKTVAMTCIELEISLGYDVFFNEIFSSFKTKDREKILYATTKFQLEGIKNNIGEIENDNFISNFFEK